ncbi:NF-kappa-B inhibitor zeta I-kappa-B-zeta [Collichthys lucidus]|uniref:NF-kappa-B inhibitor zeta I-kappa-B-zeta n=1 Tax=Collichthys lucidus TaxID=240159 RepID=A0A4U5V197_COLLU|nr:NF-kappa-B inhibitor zeta I-kappa-B-zeta [Collichthys lucidus]
MRGRYKRKHQKERYDDTADYGEGLSPLPGEATAGCTPVPGLTVQDAASSGTKKGARCPIYNSEKVYLGVRVKMPVRDLLKNIRLAQGLEPGEFQRKNITKSLEELAIIVEVLEEDLRTSNNHSPPQSYPLSDCAASPEWSPTGAGYNSEEYNDMIPSPQSYMTYSPGMAEYYQAPSPPCSMHNSLQLSSVGRDGGRGEEWFDPPSHGWNLNNSAYFWTQLQKEESLLRDVSDAELLTADEHGKTALHKVACVGKRAQGYAIAKRIAALNSLDLKDSDGMTPLLHAAKHNHHLMVADLIRLGANVNETNNLGKSCLHLSAEKGYIRVLEVLKHSMMDGVYVDVEATENSGMSVLQCASVALKATVRELESSKSPTSTRLHTLRQEQMMETLECLLQMGSYVHTMGSQSIQPTFG